MNEAVYPSLKGKKVLVTGGATGIGAALVEGFARRGSNVVLLDVDEAAGRDLAKRIDGIAFVPGGVQTPRPAKWYTPEGEEEIVTAQCLNGRIQPADVAALALFLASDDGRMCTGHEYFVDAGWR